MSLPKECPIGPRRKRRYRKGLEAGVIRKCLELLGKCPDVIYVERRNTGAVKFQDGGFIRFGSKGAADIWCLVNTAHYLSAYDKDHDQWFKSREPVGGIVHVEIECKRADGKGRQSPDQKKFQEFCDNHHIPYILTVSATKLMEEIRAIVLDK